MGRVIDIRDGLAAFVADPERYYKETPVCERLETAANAMQRIAYLEAENEHLRDEVTDLRAFVTVLDGARRALGCHRGVVGAEQHSAQGFSQ